MTDYATLLLAACVIISFKDSQAFKCYVCSYTMSSDPTVGYECVTVPSNVTTGMLSIPCQVPNMCITKTLLSQDMTHIRSVTRGCLPQQESCMGENCCNKDFYPTCEHKCRSDLCNIKNPERWLKVSGNDVIDNGKGGAARLFTSVTIVIVAITFCIIL